MKYTIPWLISEVEEGSEIKYVFVWGHTARIPGVVDNACFSQWWPSAFMIDGNKYPTAEHWMMAGKARLSKDEQRL